MIGKYLGALSLALLITTGCTQEQQNVIGRQIQNWTGTDGVLDIYAGEKLQMRFIKIDKISTALGTSDGAARPYRFGYGVLDENQNYQADPGERKIYFEVSDFSTPYVFYESPRWVPILMAVSLGLGAVAIISRYLVPSFESTNTPVLIGLVFMLCGLFTATKWK